MRFLSFFILVFIIIDCEMAFSITNAQKRKEIERLAKPLASQKIYYRWQSKEAGDNLLKAKKYTNNLFKYFMGMEITSYHFYAGHGVYVSENPHSASQFVRGSDDGSLIEVVVNKGTPYIDLSDKTTMRTLNRLGISEQEVYSLNPKVVVKYLGDEKWLAIKTTKGVSFRSFTGKGLKLKYIEDVYEKLGNDDKVKRIYRNAIRQEMIKRMKTDPNLLKKKFMLNLVNDKALTHIIRNYVLKAKLNIKYHEFIDVAKSSKRIIDIIKTQNVKLFRNLMFNERNLESLAIRLSGNEFKSVLERTIRGIVNHDDYNKFLMELDRVMSNSIYYKQRLIVSDVFKRNPLKPDKFIITQSRKNYLVKKHQKMILNDEKLKKIKKLEENSEIISDAIKKLGNNSTISGGLEIRENVLDKINNAYDFIRLMKYEVSPSDEYKFSLEKFIVKHLDYFFKFEPTHKEIIKVSKNLKHITTTISFMKQVVGRSKTPSDYLNAFHFKGGNDDFNDARSKLIMSTLDEFIDLGPSVDEMIKLTTITRTFAQDDEIRRKGIKLVKTPDEYIELVRYRGKSSDQDKYTESLIKDTVDDFFELKPKPTFTQMLTLRKESRRVEGTIDLMNKILPYVKNANQFVQLIKYYNKDQSDPYVKNMSQFIEKNWDIFLEMNPSRVDVQTVVSHILKDKRNQFVERYDTNILKKKMSEASNMGGFIKELSNENQLIPSYVKFFKENESKVLSMNYNGIEDLKYLRLFLENQEIESKVVERYIKEKIGNEVDELLLIKNQKKALEFDKEKLKWNQDKIYFRSHMLSNVKDPNFFKSLVTFSSKNSGAMYNQQLTVLLEENIDHYLSLKPSFDDVLKVLSPENLKHLNVDLFPLILDKVFNSFPDPKIHLRIFNYLVSINENLDGKYDNVVSKAFKESISAFPLELKREDFWTILEKSKMSRMRRLDIEISSSDKLSDVIKFIEYESLLSTNNKKLPLNWKNLDQILKLDASTNDVIRLNYFASNPLKVNDNGTSKLYFESLKRIQTEGELHALNDIYKDLTMFSYRPKTVSKKRDAKERVKRNSPLFYSCLKIELGL